MALTGRRNFFRGLVSLRTFPLLAVTLTVLLVVVYAAPPRNWTDIQDADVNSFPASQRAVISKLVGDLNYLYDKSGGATDAPVYAASTAYKFTNQPNHEFKGVQQLLDTNGKEVVMAYVSTEPFGGMPNAEKPPSEVTVFPGEKRPIGVHCAAGNGTTLTGHVFVEGGSVKIVMTYGGCQSNFAELHYSVSAFYKK